MRHKITMQTLILVLGLSSLPVFGQTQTERGVKVRMMNERTNSFEEVELYKKSYALVIGESRYQYTSAWKELDGVRRDVPAVEKLLREQGFDEVVVAQDLTRLELDRTIRSFIGKYGLARENRLLIYYAGHGYTETTEDGVKLGYILPIDTPSPFKEPEQFAETAISMNDIESYALSIKAKHVLFVFDSCFSGSALRKTRAGVPPIITLKAAQPVRQFITSGSEDQEVPDVSEFRKQFEEGLRGEADRNGDGYITGSELGDFLQEKVTNYSKGSQTPLTGKIANGNLDKGDFIFLPPSKPEEVEREAWLDIQDSTNPQIFREFIKEYSTGANVGKAKIKLEQLIWASVKDSGDEAKLKAYLNEFPNGANASRARLKLTELNTVITPPAQPAGKAKTFKSSIGMEFVLIPAGTLKIGSKENERNHNEDEEPQKEINIQNFWLGKYEVTQKEFENVMESTPSYFKYCPRCPVELVSWEDAQKFIKKLNMKNDGFEYKLPSEAEWEYAARAGTSTGYYWGDDLDEKEIDAFAWYYANSNGKTHEVGLKQPNGFGLYDMSGNVEEWCESVYIDNYRYTNMSGEIDVSGRDLSKKVVRGGSWLLNKKFLRSATRSYFTLTNRYYYLGFRVAARVR